MIADTTDNTPFVDPEIDHPTPADRSGAKYVTVSSLTTWDQTEEPVRENVPKTPSREIKFPFRKEINKRIALFDGSFEDIVVDALVCPTNERMDDMGGPHEVLRKDGGEQLRHDLLIAGTCRMSECKATPGYNIGSK